MQFSHKIQMVFWRLDVLQKIEQIIEKEAATLQPRNIKNVADCLLQIGINPARAVQVASGAHGLDHRHRQAFADFFDKDKNQRFETERDINELENRIKKLRRRKVDNIEELYECQDQISEVESDLAVLKSKLATLTKRNTVDESTFKYPTQEVLLQRKLIEFPKHSTNPYPQLTKRGQEVYESMLELSDMARSRVERGMSIDNEFIQDSWVRMREIYHEEAKLKKLFRKLI